MNMRPINALMIVFLVILLSGIVSPNSGAVEETYSNIESPNKENLTKNVSDTIDPKYPENIEGLSKEDLIKAGFSTRNDTKNNTKNDIINQYISIPEGVDYYGLDWQTQYEDPWFGEDYIYYYGGDAIQSGRIYDNEKTWVAATVYGPGTIGFFWSVSSEANFDYLEFYIDDVLKSKISGNVAWTPKSYYVGSGNHVVKWRYIKDGSVSVGEDAGYVDKVLWSNGASLKEALDNNVLQWSSYGSAKWFGQKDMSCYDRDSARSGYIGHNQYTTLRTYVPEGKLSFSWSVSSEANFDYLEFYIDGVSKSKISGEIYCQRKTYTLGSGNHTLLWKYKKDASVSTGEDAGFVDRVVFQPAVTLYEDINYGGISQKYYGNIPWIGYTMNDVTSSLKVAKGYKVTLYENIDYGGISQTFTENSPWVGYNINDVASSLKVSKI